MNRIVAFGSSNTIIGTHNEGRHSWACWLTFALQQSVKQRVWVLNTGIGGNTAADLVARVDGDVVAVHPHLVIITIGGNDSGRGRPLPDFEADLRSLEKTLQEAGALVVFQTYYALLPEVGHDVTKHMEVERRVAESTGAGLIDQYAWFHPWLKSDPTGYRAIMKDPGHLNALGNALFGIIAARCFGVSDPPLPADMQQSVADGLTVLERHGAPRRVQAAIDKL
ncbi:MAG: SGNH/GDSL hydrolase family protein [Verrucomicrobiota bacterium]